MSTEARCLDRDQLAALLVADVLCTASTIDGRPDGKALEDLETNAGTEAAMVEQLVVQALEPAEPIKIEALRQKYLKN